MSYCCKNFPSKKAMADAVKAGEKLTIYNPGLGTPVVDGVTDVCGPWFPKPHKWYANVTMVNGIITKVK